MSCSLNKTKKLARDKGIMNEFNNLPSDTPQSVNNFNKFAANIKDLAISKFGKLPEGLTQPIRLEGIKVIFNRGFFEWVDRENDKLSSNQNKLFQKQSQEGIIASEKTIRDLAARISDRIGIPYKIISDRTQEFKGKIESNTAIINLAYATLDTPIHEILGHPIIRAIKNNKVLSEKEFTQEIYEGKRTLKGKTVLDDYIDYQSEKLQQNNYHKLYQNLLKELEYGKGKEVLDRIKRDYVYKADFKRDNIIKQINDLKFEENQYIKWDEKEALASVQERKKVLEEELEKNYSANKYSLEEQQEEAIVELLGLMTADKLDAVKDGKLISLLKRLLKEMKQFVRSLLRQRKVEIDKLPDNMTLGDLADLLAYSNSKLILPGYEVIYTTPDNQQFKTYAEASNHISELTKSVRDVDLDNIKIQKEKVNNPDDIIVDSFEIRHDDKMPSEYVRIDGKWYQEVFYTPEYSGDPGVEHYPISDEKIISLFNSPEQIGVFKTGIDILGFIQKNKEYEQSKEIIEEWKKVNNIQYNPEEIYSRGQEFSSVVGAYSSFDVNLMMQNLLQHIEDNEKAGGKFAISAFTKPIDKQIGHLEGEGGKIKFKIYPKSEDILWAANTDVYSGSVWDASEKVSKDKKSELLGVSYTKYPALVNVNKVQPNLASIVDDLAHHHNELGIVLTGNNFRLEYDEDIPYSTKKIIDSVNSILDEKYGKLVKPEISKITTIPNTFEYWQQDMYEDGGVDRFKIKIYKKDNKWFEEFFDTRGQSESIREITYKEVETQFNEALASNSTLTKNKGIQPTQTNETLKESIQNIINKIPRQGEFDYYESDGYFYITQNQTEIGVVASKEEALKQIKELNNGNKEYTSQALINTKIAKLKEVAKKYPRSLIRSEVKKETNKYGLEREFFGDELPFQKISSVNYQSLLSLKPNTDITEQEWDELDQEEKEVILYQAKNC